MVALILLCSTVVRCTSNSFKVTTTCFSIYTGADALFRLGGSVIVLLSILLLLLPFLILFSFFLFSLLFDWLVVVLFLHLCLGFYPLAALLLPVVGLSSPFYIPGFVCQIA